LKREVFKNICTGAIFEFVFALAFSGIAIIFEAFYAVISWGTSIIDIFKGFPYYLLNYSIELVIPFTINCALTSILITIILLAKSHLKERIFISICVILCSVISITTYHFILGMITEPDEPTRNFLEFVFRKLPSILFVIWGYFYSRYIYRNTNQISHG